MKAEDLAFVADALLALCDKDERAPFEIQATFEHKLRHGPKLDPLFDHLSRGGDDPLLRVECEAVIDSARLTMRQTEVLSWRLDGYTFDQIGCRTGHTKQAAQRVFVQALKKLAHALNVYPYKGLSDIYRRELRRGCRQGSFGRI